MNTETEQTKLPLHKVSVTVEQEWIPPKEGHWIDVRKLEFDGEKFTLSWLIQLIEDGKIEFPYRENDEIKRLKELGLVTNFKKPDAKFYDSGPWHPTRLLQDVMGEIGEGEWW